MNIDQLTLTIFRSDCDSNYYVTAPPTGERKGRPSYQVCDFLREGGGLAVLICVYLL